MRRICLAVCAALVPVHATADDTCRAEIVALFQGPLDPFQRPPHKQMTTAYGSDGTVLFELLSHVETPLRSIAGQPSANWFTMVIDEEMWNGPSVDGPWTLNAAKMPAGRDAQLKQVTQDNIENLTDTACHGASSDGHVRYTFRTKSNPDAAGTFFGALYTITFDPGSRQVIRFEQTDFINSWSDGVSKDRWIIDVVFDPTLTVRPPE